MAFENVGRVWMPSTYPEYLATLTKPSWCNAITLHHCAAPSLAQRPHGFTPGHIRNLQDFYQNQKGWSSGPHLFVDDDQLWGMCDLRKKGIHAVSFNSRAIGIEVLGDYDVESAKSGRGLACWRTAALATKQLLDWLGLPLNKQTVLFHRDDPTTNKTCPGTKVDKDWLLQLINGATPAAATKPPKPDIGVTLPSDQWRFVGERWCVPVRAFLRKKGVTESDIAANLKKIGPDFFYQGELLEGAFFDLPTSATWAPTRELVHLV